MERTCSKVVQYTANTDSLQEPQTSEAKLKKYDSHEKKLVAKYGLRGLECRGEMD
jgi:hypothetical protein